MVVLLAAFLYPYLSITQMILLVIVLGLVWYCYRSMKKSQNYWKDKGVSYVEPKLFAGLMMMFRRNMSVAELTQEMYKQFPDERYHGGYQFSSPILVIKDAELLKTIAVKEFESFMNHRPIVDADADPLFSKNLVSLEGERWRDMRSTLSPSFTSSKMKMMFVLMEECAQQFVQYFKKQPEDVIEVEAKDIFSRYANDVIASTSFGIKCDSLEDKENEFYLKGKDASSLFGGFVQVLKIFTFMISPFIAKMLKLRIFSAATREYFTNVIVETMQTRKNQNIIRPDMIHLMMEAQKERATNQESNLNKKVEITTTDIVANAFIFFVAGFDTTSTFLTFTFYELAVNPDVQSRLRNEINAVWKTCNGAITYEALLGMKYLDMVVSEALRKWPPAFMTERRTNKAHTIEPERPGEKRVVVEEGTIVWLAIYAIHRDPKFHPEPDKFDPERFSEERKHEMNPSTFLPFGMGPRNCIGSRFALLEGKLLIFHILRSFEVVPIEKTKIPLALDKKDLVMKPEGGTMWFGLKKIDS